MRKVEITRGTVAGGKPVAVGQVVKLDDADAAQLIALGKAVPVGQAPPKVDNRDNDHAEKISKRTTAKSKPKKSKD